MHISEADIDKAVHKAIDNIKLREPMPPAQELITKKAAAADQLNYLNMAVLTSKGFIALPLVIAAASLYKQSAGMIITVVGVIIGCFAFWTFSKRIEYLKKTYGL